jgi:hypothetical protein
MPDPRPTWQLVLEAARLLTASDQSPFKLSDLIALVQRADAGRDRGTVQPVVQGMTANAGKGPASPCGKVLLRVERGYYKLLDGSDTAPTTRSVSAQSSSDRRRVRTLGLPEVHARLDALIADFERCVDRFEAAVPFTRTQYELHRRTIDRRSALGSVEAAIHDDEFTELLHRTLQQWGIGRRASRLAPLAAFRRALIDHLPQLLELEPHLLEQLTEGVGSISAAIDRLISDLGVVDNHARIVAGTKTLHHVLPDLVPPMDRAWTGAFFGWSALDPQTSQSLIVGEAYEGFAAIARARRPSRLVGEGWRTSSTKILDNALIGYCMLQGIGGRPS